MESTTADLKLTNAQEKALEMSIARVAYSNIVRMNRAAAANKEDASTYRLRMLAVTVSEYGTVEVQGTIDNGKPGTFGFNYPTHFQYFIGKRGGITVYKEASRKGKRHFKRIKGNSALIFCTF